MTETDETIYRRFLTERNEDDLRILLERHKEQLILFLNGYVHNLEDAEELMIDAFAEAAAGTAPFLERSSFKTWLFSIGKKLALQRLRKAKKRESGRFLPPEEQTPELEILQSERDRQLYLALETLHDDYRQALVLLYFEGMSHEEAGRILGKNRRQMYNLAERGRKALKEALEKIGVHYAYD